MNPERKRQLAGALIRALVAALLVSLVVSAIPTALDWRANPVSIFHDAAGTHWDVVFETLLSWFWPLLFFFAPAFLIVTAWVSLRRSKSGSAPTGNSADLN